MRNWLLFSLCLLSGYLLTSCSISHWEAQKKPLERYVDYVDSLANRSTLMILKEFWSNVYVMEGERVLNDISEGNRKNRNTVIAIVRFPSQMSSISYQKQVMTDNKACVLIAGMSSDSQRIVFNTPYRLENNRWLIDGEIAIAYIELGEPFPEQPNCNVANS